MGKGAKRPFAGHLRSQSSQRDVTLALLLREYDGYKPFVVHCLETRRQIEARGNDRAALHVAVRRVAERWNLHHIPDVREMNYRLLEKGILRTGTVIGTERTMRELTPFAWRSGMLFAGPGVEIRWNGHTWSWRNTSPESFADLRDRIMRDIEVTRASRLPSAIRTQLADLAATARERGLGVSDVAHELLRAVRWLFLWLCPQPDEPLTIAQIALQDCDYDEPTLRRRVRQLARNLRIDLPVPGPGHPRTR